MCVVNNKTHANKGFTLIELVLVITVMSILFAMGSRFIVSATESYSLANNRALLLNQGRQVTEQVSRLLRNSLPNSIRISGSGRCIEYLPIVAGANYETDVAVSGDSNSTSVVTTAPFNLGLGTPRYAVVGAFSNAELYISLTSPAAISGIGHLAGSGITSISLSSPHQFLRPSLSERIYLVDNPSRICVNASSGVRLYSNYGLPSGGISDTAPNTGVLLAGDSVLDGETPFVLATASVNRNAVIQMSLPFERNGERVVIEHRVYIRNVP